MKLLRRRPKFDVVSYVDAVADLCALRFEWSPMTRDIFVRNALRCSGGFGSAYEFIVDNPASASWRLKANPAAGPFGLRLSDYAYPPADRPERTAEAAAFTAALTDLVDSHTR